MARLSLAVHLTFLYSILTSLFYLRHLPTQPGTKLLHAWSDNLSTKTLCPDMFNRHGLLVFTLHPNTINFHSFIQSIGCAEFDDSLPFSGASSSPLCYVFFSCHPSPPTIRRSSLTSSAIYFLVYLSILLFPNSYIIFFREFYFLPFSEHDQTKPNLLLTYWLKITFTFHCGMQDSHKYRITGHKHWIQKKKKERLQCHNDVFLFMISYSFTIYILVMYKRSSTNTSSLIYLYFFNPALFCNINTE